MSAPIGGDGRGYDGIDNSDYFWRTRFTPQYIVALVYSFALITHRRNS